MERLPAAASAAWRVVCESAGVNAQPPLSLSAAEYALRAALLEVRET
jgi:hypothetical protein